MVELSALLKHVRKNEAKTVPAITMHQLLLNETAPTPQEEVGRLDEKHS